MGGCSSLVWVQKGWTGDERVPLLGGLCNHWVEDVLFKMDPHQGLNCAVLWSPSPAIFKALATLIPASPSLRIRCHPLGCATRPTRGPGARPSPAYSFWRPPPPATHCAEASDFHLYPPRPPVASSRARVSRCPSAPTSPAPLARAQRRKTGD